jgi:hypothetical protein
MKQIKLSLRLGLAGILLAHMPLAFAENAKLVTGTKVEKHVVQNEGYHFAFHDGQVWAQVELKPSTDGHVTFVWTRDGHPYHELKLTTKKADRYRVAGYVTARPGKWHVAVKSDANVVLAEKDFVVEGVDAGTHKPNVDSSGHKSSAAHVAKKGTTTAAGHENEADKPKSSIVGALKAINPTETKADAKADAKADVVANSVETKSAPLS